MSTHNICFHGEVRKIAILLLILKHLNKTMYLIVIFLYLKVFSCPSAYRCKLVCFNFYILR